jgi:hypothetical protein
MLRLHEMPQLNIWEQDLNELLIHPTPLPRGKTDDNPNIAIFDGAKGAKSIQRFLFLLVDDSFTSLIFLCMPASLRKHF